jgi:hypothetical protein
MSGPTEKMFIGQWIGFQEMPIAPSISANDANLIRKRSRHARPLQMSPNAGGNEIAGAGDARQSGNNA